MTAALATMMGVYRPYLLALANRTLDPELLSKGGGSDLVQETFLEAHRGLGQFRGGTEEEFLAWLRQILIHNIANFRRRYHASEKRAISREVSLETVPPQEVPAVAPLDGQFQEAEEVGRLDQALSRLTTEYRDIIVWRSLERLPFRDIAARRGVSEAAAQKCWVRAVFALRSLLGEAGRGQAE
jgi:RNA polymerase sigma-70 factor (ECF subfamily)